MHKITVPTLGESISEATIQELKKNSGEVVKQDEVIALLETDKVTIEIASPCNGVLTELCVKEGDNVEVGALIGRVDESASSNIEKQVNTAQKVEISVAPTAGKQDSPAAKVLMQEKGLTRQAIHGTGLNDRITKEDVLKFSDVKNNTILATDICPASGSNPSLSSREEKIVKMSKLRQRIAHRLKESQNTAAILTTFNEVDMTNVMSIRAKYKDAFEKKYAIKLGFMSFFTRATVLALQEIPAINAEIKDNNLFVFKEYCDIGVAVGTENGLVVPVLRNAENLSLAEIEKNIAILGKKAKEGKLTVKDMEGGTFTITNGGVYGSLMSTPILNPPQSGILGMHTIQKRPMVMENGEIKARSMMYLALSYDHRIVDGKEAVTFLVKIKNYIENPERLLLNI